MSIALIIPLVGQLMELGFKITEAIDKADEIDPTDKEALKAQIKKAQSGVQFWKDDETAVPDGAQSEVLNT